MTERYYQKTIDDICSLEILPDFQAKIVIDVNKSGWVQLEGKEEADQLIKEFEDPDGELCHAEGSIMGKYEVFDSFRP